MMLPSRRVVPLRARKSMDNYLWRTKESLDFAWATRAAVLAAPKAAYVLYMEARGFARAPLAPYAAFLCALALLLWFAIW